MRTSACSATMATAAADTDGCTPLGTINDVRLALCSHHSPADGVTATIASAAEAEGAGRLHGGAPDIAAGAALLITLPPGQTYRITSSPASC